jgi:hypothetical protein
MHQTGQTGSESTRLTGSGIATAPNEWRLAERLVSGPALRATRPFVDLQSDSEWLLRAATDEDLDLREVLVDLLGRRPTISIRLGP